MSADRALNPEPPAYKAVALTSWSYRPVGHLGVEPSYTALSERPLRPDGPWPMNLARRRGDRYAMAEDGELESHGVTRRPVSGRGQPPGWFILRGEWVTRTPRR